MPTTLQSDSSYLGAAPTARLWLFNCLNSDDITTRQLTLWKKAVQLVFKELCDKTELMLKLTGENSSLMISVMSLIRGDGTDEFRTSYEDV